MAAVRGSKQHEMIVVAHRPLQMVSMFCVFVGVIAALCWLTYQTGKDEGLAMKVAVVKERDRIRSQLDDTRKTMDDIRRENADLRLGEEVDSRATEEVRQTVEVLQGRIAQLDEEILFYKGVMVPNVGDRGLRIERLDMQNTAVPNRFRYRLLLTQVVDKHDYVQGGVKISLEGLDGQMEKHLSLGELDSSQPESIRFRFKYFQNVDGELTIPLGFEPREVKIVAQSSGRNAQRLERTFDWQLKGG